MANDSDDDCYRTHPDETKQTGLTVSQVSDMPLKDKANLKYCADCERYYPK